MPTYNASAVADGVIAFEKGITIQQGRALRDNPIAMAEGQANAPRFAVKTRILAESETASPFLAGYQGLRIWGTVTIDAAPGSQLDIEFSNDGSTWPDSIVLTTDGIYEIWVDFATGDWKWINASLGTRANGTMASIPTNPTGIRLTGTGAATDAMVTLVPNGGEAVS